MSVAMVGSAVRRSCGAKSSRVGTGALERRDRLHDHAFAHGAAGLANGKPVQTPAIRPEIHPWRSLCRLESAANLEEEFLLTG